MNNNNRGNNRRRGRGGNRQQGGQQINRIDSRARGNAPQLLEKYKKLAHDAHLNGDRVQEEYYLQFADHYFRVLADQRQRLDEVRQPRRDDRSQDYDNDAVSDDETEIEPARGYHNRDVRSDVRGHRGSQGNVQDAQVESEATEAGEERDSEGERSVYEPSPNPFVRDSRGVRGGLKERKPRRNRDERVEANGNESAPEGPHDESDGEAASGNFDPAALPPAISAKADEKPKRRARAKKTEDGEADDDGEDKPKRRRTRKASSSTDGTGGSALEAVD